MAIDDETQEVYLKNLGLKQFKQKLPWLGGDLQTLRDSFIVEKLPIDAGQTITIDVPSLPSGLATSGKLIAFLDLPKDETSINGLVLMIHGLGGSSRRQGLRRMSYKLLNSGFAILRLNLRGADPGRDLISGTYSANCSSDLIPAIVKAKEICEMLEKKSHIQRTIAKKSIPIFGVGISLGGTILLNACLEKSKHFQSEKAILKGLACVSSPLDLAECSSSIERPRNKIYQFWLLQRLVRQTLEDPNFTNTGKEKELFLKLSEKNNNLIRSIRDFDSLVTAPRWGFKDVDDYYQKASPINKLRSNLKLLPKTLLVQSNDDPWVPSTSLKDFSKEVSKQNETCKVDILITKLGGHNGYHGIDGCWGDQLVNNWLLKLCR